MTTSTASASTARRTATVDDRTRADVLIEALPYIREFTDKRVVVKLSGNAMADPELALQVRPTSC